MIGSLMYLTNMRPDIFFAMKTLSQFLTDPRHVHLIAGKHILRYLKGTIDYGLKYEANQKINFEGYVDLDWVGSAIDRKRKLATKFEMKDLGMMHYFLGMEVWQSVDGISLGQGKYTVEILKRFGMMDCKAMTTPMASNLKRLSDDSLEAADAMIYR